MIKNKIFANLDAREDKYLNQVIHSSCNLLISGNLDWMERGMQLFAGGTGQGSTENGMCTFVGLSKSAYLKINTGVNRNPNANNINFNI